MKYIFLLRKTTEALVKYWKILRDAEIQNTWLMRKGWKNWVLLTWNGKIRGRKVTVFKQRKGYCTKDSIQLSSVLLRPTFPWFWKPAGLVFCRWGYRWGQTIINFSETAMGNACSFQRHLLQHGKPKCRGTVAEPAVAAGGWGPELDTVPGLAHTCIGPWQPK